MHYLFYFGHPAQYLFLRETIRRLAKSNRHTITILIKTKDVLEDLIKHDGLPYTNILVKTRKKGTAFIALSFLERIINLIPILIRKKPDVLVSTDATLAQLGKLFGMHRITILEDDYEVIKKLARLTYPFTEAILCPDVCSVGSWTAKKVGYQGYMKLGYLHPAVFQPDPAVCQKYLLNKPFVLIRLTSLQAHHDKGVRGIDALFLDTLIQLILSHGYVVYISSETKVKLELERYLLPVDPSDMHHVLAQAYLLLSDSQSMSVEAAMLGTPSIRYSDFTGRISVLEELEHTYELTVGILPGEERKLVTRLMDLLLKPNCAAIFQERRRRMLGDKLNITEFMVWFLETYPDSVATLKTDPKYQNRFIDQFSRGQPFA